MNLTYLAIGTNIGNRGANLELAISAINRLVGVVEVQSSTYQTAAWGLEHQADFYNQVLCVKTELEPIFLLKECQEIEKKMGRVRKENWGPRVIDIDILFFNDSTIKSTRLTIPHPLLQDRNFVLVPLCEIAEDRVHPVFQKKMVTLLRECKDELEVSLVTFLEKK